MSEPTKGDRWTCGTSSGYVIHRRAGEDACDACRAAGNAYRRARYAKDPGPAKAAALVQSRARQRLVAAHRDEYRRYYAEELTRLRERSRDASQ